MSHKGVCIGGPMAGLTMTIRSDVGFVAVDAPGSAAWLYYPDLATGRFLLDITPDASSLGTDGTRALDLERVLMAGLNKGLDVIAVPGDGVQADDEVLAAADLFAGLMEEPIVAGDPAEGQD